LVEAVCEEENTSDNFLTAKVLKKLSKIVPIHRIGNLESPNKKMIEIMIRNARIMGLILDSNLPTEGAFVINALKMTPLNYEFRDQEMHKIAYLKNFLTYDGALLIMFAKRILQGGIERYSFIKSGEWDDMIKSMLDSYSNLQLNRSDLVTFRRIREFTKKNKYNPDTIRHLFPPRVGALCDFDIIKYQKGQNKIKYYVKTDGITTTEKFAELFPNFESLDESLARDGDFFSRISNLYGFNTEKIDISKDYELIKKHILKAYNLAKIDRTGNVSITAIEDIVCIMILFGINPDLNNGFTVKSFDRSKGKICEIMNVRNIMDSMTAEMDEITILVDKLSRPKWMKINN